MNVNEIKENLLEALEHIPDDNLEASEPIRASLEILKQVEPESIVKHSTDLDGNVNKYTYCYSCGTGVRNQKYCHGCGRKLIWNKAEPEHFAHAKKIVAGWPEWKQKVGEPKKTELPPMMEAEGTYGRIFGKKQAEPPLKTCEFCGCQTNAKQRACCIAGREADKKSEPPPAWDRLTEKEANLIEAEMRRLENDEKVSKHGLRLYMQSLMSCGHAVGNLLTCYSPPYGCVICNSMTTMEKENVRMKQLIESYGTNPAGFDWGVLDKLDELEADNKALKERTEKLETLLREFKFSAPVMRVPNWVVFKCEQALAEGESEYMQPEKEKQG